MEKALAEAKAKAAVYDFATALSLLDAANVTETSLAEAKANERKKIGWLNNWKRVLMADIKSGRFKAAVQIGAAAYQGATKADETRITFRLPPYGTTDVDWVKVPPKTLLAMSVSLISPNTPDTADRQWLSAVFANFTGQTETANSLAKSASDAKPEYREQLKLLAPPKP